MKELVTQLSKDLFQAKIDIEKELSEGNKSNAELYSLILKTIDFLKAKRKGSPISKKLPVYKYLRKNMALQIYF